MTRLCLADMREPTLLSLVPWYVTPTPLWWRLLCMPGRSGPTDVGGAAATVARASPKQQSNT